MTDSDGQGGGNAGTDRTGTSQPPDTAEAPALAIIEAFGGIRPMAKQLGLAVSTVQGWKERSAIPANRHDQIRAAAQKNSVDIDPAVLRASAPSEGGSAQPQVIEGKATAVSDKGPGENAKANEKKTDKQDGKLAEKLDEKLDESGRMSAASAAAKPRPAGGDAGKSDKPGGDAGKSDKSGDAGKSEKPGAGKSQVPPSSAPPSSPSSSSSSGRGSGFLPGLGLGVLLAVAVAGATIYTQPYWRGFLGQGDSAQGDSVSAALGDMETRLEELQAALPADNSAALSGLSERLATLESAISQGGGQDPDTRAALESLNTQMARVTDRLEAAEQDLTALRNVASSPSPELSSRLSSEAQRLDDLLREQSELATRLAETEEALNAAAAAREAAPGSRETLMLLATLQLRDALRGSGPYDQPLTMLQNLAGEDAALASAIAPLERRAPAGLPSLLDLQASFPEVARRIAAIEVGEEGEGWSAGVLRRVAEAVNLRPVGLVEGDAPTAVAARAEVKLNDGDLAGALAELDALEGAAAEAAASWRADAEARLAAERAVSALGALVSQRFATLAGG